MGAAIKDGLGDEGFEIWDKWSRQSKSYVERDAREVWRGFKLGLGITLGTLFYEAKMNGWTDTGERPTKEELAEQRRRANERTSKEKARKAREQAEAARKAGEIWRSATSARDDHPYLVRKGVSPVETLRQIPDNKAATILGYAPASNGNALTGSLLVAPIYAGGLSTVEFIDEGGCKAALCGGRKGGGHWPAQPLPDGDGTGLTLLIGEGVATVLSAREATGHPALATLTCSNLKIVATAMRERFPLARLVILGDLGNGQKDAEEAAAAARATLALPDFGEERNSFKDFNEMAALRGREAVAKCIRRQAPTATATEVLGTFRKWLYLPDPGVVYVPLGAVAANLMEGDPIWLMIVGPSSGGKTEIIIAIVRLPYVRLGSTLTEAALLSGTPGKQMAAGSKGGLLSLVREVGKFAILALKDFTGILSIRLLKNPVL